MTLNMHDAPLLLVALIVFGGVFVYLWRLDARVRGLEGELREELMHAPKGHGAVRDE